MSDFFDNSNDGSFNQGYSSQGDYPPKPEVVEKKENMLVQSLFSLLTYFVLFYFLFEKNIAYIAAILMVIIIHEMGHLLAMKAFKYSNVKIFFLPLVGAFTSGKKQEVSQFQLSLIILAGPLPGILIAFVLYYININLQNETIKMLCNSFLIINLFNLLPIYPLDGGRLIQTLFFKQNHLIRLIFGIISIMMLTALFIFTSPFMLIVPVMMGIELFNENKNNKIRTYLTSENIDYHKEYNNLPNKNYWLIRDCLLFAFPKKYGGLQPGVYQYSIVEPLLMKHVNTILQINLIYDLSILKQLFILLLYICAFALPLAFFSLHL